ncbi:MAG: hypothetical protein CMQ15_01965 [Gammaproteobacteria bacterium]|jgi:hypothetical protein|nr:hypothetical protein [Gammaproteobacteria bacterium]|tara:strand:+ start:727 stop:963 length:237 start_codon:yes stop_codon:yes gene_type:complete
MPTNSHDNPLEKNLEPLIPIKHSLEDGTLPISESSLYAGIASGRYPRPIKIGSRNFYTPSTHKKIRASFEPINVEELS